MPSMRFMIFATVLLFICLNLAVADPRAIHIHRRDGPTTPSTSPELSAAPTSSPSQTDQGKGGDSGGDNITSKPPAKVLPSTVASNSTTSSRQSPTPTQNPVTPIISNINGPAPTLSLNPTIFNATITPGALPIQPVITPAYAVAGVLLMISGAVYTLVGIKNKQLHIYLSATYLASVSVTVLVIYVMNTPISNAIQGAYLVAVVMTGLVLGGASIVFSEMTEGLGCLFGGFCFSMWLLVLKPGGLLTSTSAKSAFIAAFTLAAFSTTFSHYTRPYGLIIFISFGGATAVVLGIDCFSRAGLKEFWVYLWDLNDNLFPLGATTYPLTRGIRVEIAAIIILFLAGILSQMKLWKVIRERREQRAAERLEDERTMEQEEVNVGRRIERSNAQERGHWEAVYGDKDGVKVAEQSLRDSGVGDMESHKKGPISTVTSLRNSGDDDIEMSPMHPPLSMAGLVMGNKGHDGGPVTIRVARDAEPPTVLDENGNPVNVLERRSSYMSARSPMQEVQDEKVWVTGGGNDEARLERRPSQRSLKRASNITSPRSPEVVPLPFKIPEDGIDDDRSSVATFADEEHAHKRLSKRLSTGPQLFRKLSRRSQRNSKRFSATSENRSTEDLVIPHAEDDRRSSVAATMDGLSDDEDSRSKRSTMEAFKHDEGREEGVPKLTLSNMKELESATGMVTVPVKGDGKRPTSTSTVNTDILDEVRSPTEQIDIASNSKSPVQQMPESEPLNAAGVKITEGPQTAPRSTKSAIDNKPASISQSNLPPQLSRVVMSYRTNEWAKHLSNADTPFVEDLKLEEYPAEMDEAEVAAPVNVEELQQTAENAMPPPAPRASLNIARNSTSPYMMRPEAASGYQAPEGGISRSMSQQSLHGAGASSLQRGLGIRNSSTPHIPQAIVEDSASAANFANSYASLPNYNNTLLSQRDTLLRNKSSISPSPYSTPNLSQPPPALTSTPALTASNLHSTAPPSRANSDAGSVYNFHNNSLTMIMDDDSMSLSARRAIIRNSNVQLPSATVVNNAPPGFDSHQPRREKSVPSKREREMQLSSWRESVQADIKAGGLSVGNGEREKREIERQRVVLWEERKGYEVRAEEERRRKEERERVADGRMRRGMAGGGLQDRHREALRRMQREAMKGT